MTSEVQELLREMEKVRELLIDAEPHERTALLAINRALLARFKHLTSE